MPSDSPNHSGFAPDWLRLFPEEPYRFHLGVRPADATAFFRPSAAHAQVCAQRAHWLTEAPETYAVFASGGADLLRHALAFAGTTSPTAASDLAAYADSFSALLTLGRFWEPDFLLLGQDPDGEFRLRAGVVCFPSSWDLHEKLGHRVAEIHGVVPDLNRQIGTRISTFLARLVQGAAWRRENWGLARTGELNHHPGRRLAGLDRDTPIDEVWIRVEHQVFLRICDGGLLFGIRVTTHPIVEVLRQPGVAHRLAHALASMPEPVAEYKGLVLARAALLKQITELAGPAESKASGE